MKYFLRFTIGNIKLAVPVDEVGEIARPKEITRKGKLAKYFIGFIKLRKETVPVFDLHEFFGIKPVKRFEIIISDINNSNIGVKVDKILLQKRVDGELGRLGFPRERRAFSPHLTLARVRRGATRRKVEALGRSVAKECIGELARMRVDAASIISSDLRPEGAIYTELFRASLGEHE